MPTYYCKFRMVTNLGNNRLIFIKQDADNEQLGKILILHRMLKLTKDGMPRVYFENGDKYNQSRVIFTHSNDNTIQGNEYIEIDSEFFSNLSSAKLNIVMIDMIKKLGLNYKAKPFIPLM
jgi:hypothetical protein